jgi:ssDNA-binding Zn-finger/Zn-ribbon topoisomerase 1
MRIMSHNLKYAGECPLCNSSAVLFFYKNKEGEFKACSNCFTTKHITGWSI